MAIRVVAKKQRVDKSVDGMEMLVCRNPKATQKFDFESKLEAGMMLQGSEVKSLRNRQGDLDGSFALIHQDELYLYKMHIPPYTQAGARGHEPKRQRKLLVHRHEIEKIRGKLARQGYSLVPLMVYFKSGVAKVQLGLGRGKRQGDERASLKQKQELTEARDAVNRQKGRGRE